MSRIVIVTLIYQRHKVLGQFEGLHESVYILSLFAAAEIFSPIYTTSYK
jgi:hypothetical protein